MLPEMLPTREEWDKWKRPKRRYWYSTYKGFLPVGYKDYPEKEIKLMSYNNICCATAPATKQETPTPLNYGYKMHCPENLVVSVVGTSYSESNISLANIQCSPSHTHTLSGYVQKEEENTMFDLKQEQIRHLQRRLESVRDDSYQAMRKAFGLENCTRPKTPQEMIATITAGKFELRKPDEETDGIYYDNPWNYFIWRDPNVKLDRDGFDAAREQMDKDTIPVRDVILSGDYDKGLAAIAEFEAKTYH